MMKWFRRSPAVSVLLALALLGSTAMVTTVASGSAAAAATVTKFGTLSTPCGPGSAKGATEQGVTDTSIHIAYGDDRGYSGSPGLDQEMGNAVRSFISWCNSQGGINGRKVVGDYYDAAVLNANTVMTQACKTDFMMVGEGFALDQSAEQTRLGCNLVQVPGFAVGSDVANAYESYQPTPNPVNMSPVSSAYQVKALFPSKVLKVGEYSENLSPVEVSMAKAKQAFQQTGWKYLNCPFQIQYTGEPDYTPFAQKLQSCGAQVVYTDTSPGPELYGILQADNQIGYNPIWLGDTNLYSPEFAAWNTSGLANNFYVRSAYEPLEAAKVVPAVKQFLSIVKPYGPTDQLGEQSGSAFLLWATAAKACGSTLTRQCMVNQLSKVTTWTGGGLSAPGNPAKNTPPQCGLLLRLQNTKWTQAVPKKLGSFQCSSKYVVPNTGAAVLGTTLNAEGYSTKYVTPQTIKPQS
jgi:ABC-type branched-subunit amino acid transport system substrate-binding protein